MTVGLMAAALSPPLTRQSAGFRSHSAAAAATACGIVAVHRSTCRAILPLSVLHRQHAVALVSCSLAARCADVAQRGIVPCRHQARASNYAAQHGEDFSARIAITDTQSIF